MLIIKNYQDLRRGVILVGDKDGLSEGMVLKSRVPHVCGSNLWTIIYLGSDIVLKCNDCSAVVMVARKKIFRQFRKMQ
jgi:hypothetical protein